MHEILWQHCLYIGHGIDNSDDLQDGDMRFVSVLVMSTAWLEDDGMGWECCCLWCDMYAKGKLGDFVTKRIVMVDGEEMGCYKYAYDDCRIIESCWDVMEVAVGYDATCMVMVG